LNGFAIVLGLGAALGLLRVSRQRSGQWLDAGLLVLLGALLGARLGYVLVHLPYYAAHPAEILALKAGGLSANGAVLGWGLGLALAALIFRVRFLRLADWLYPLLPPLAVTGFLASWLAGVAYGPQLPAGTWWGIPAPDESGLAALRWPLQPAAALALLVFYWLMEQLILLPRPSGWLFSLAASWYIVIDLVVSLLRADPQPAWGALRLATLGDLVALIFSLGLLAALTFIDRRKTNPKITEPL
jgi:phosphatidylglycerol---prolipoprotein diacylglyceryl transferase